jgi:hypothetical protein
LSEKSRIVNNYIGIDEELLKSVTFEKELKTLFTYKNKIKGILPDLPTTISLL